MNIRRDLRYNDNIIIIIIISVIVYCALIKFRIVANGDGGRRAKGIVVVVEMSEVE